MVVLGVHGRSLRGIELRKRAAEDFAGGAADHAFGDAIDVGELAIQALHVHGARHVLHEQSEAELAFLQRPFRIAADPALERLVQGMPHRGQQPHPVRFRDVVQRTLSQGLEFLLFGPRLRNEDERDRGAQPAHQFQGLHPADFGESEFSENQIGLEPLQPFFDPGARVCTLGHCLDAHLNQVRCQEVGR